MKRPSSSMCVALAALVLAATGSAHAAGLIGSAQVQNGSLTGVDIKNGSLPGKELKKASVNANRLSAKAKASLRGQQGVPGETGPQGPSDLYLTGDSKIAGSTPGSLSEVIPAGEYLILGTALAFGGNNVAAGCRIYLDLIELTAAFSYDTAGGDQTLNMQTHRTLTEPGTLTMQCTGGSNFGYAEIAALKVQTIH